MDDYRMTGQAAAPQVLHKRNYLVNTSTSSHYKCTSMLADTNLHAQSDCMRELVRALALELILLTLQCIHTV